jgi:putative transcriptional regulator
VQGPLIAIHMQEPLSDAEIIPGLFLSTHKDNLEALVRQEEIDFRIFVGHSGWGDGQLDNECAAGDWLTNPASLELVFRDAYSLWQELNNQIGGSILSSSIKTMHKPKDARLN